MHPTLRWLVRRSELRLRPLVEVDFDNAIRWVHVSELADPTPFLAGGELLLTTGKGAAQHWDAYVRRLVDRGVAGLGFGIGIAHDTVPAGLVEAAAARGLPLLEVPEPTPFIAISEAVAAEHARVQERTLNSALEAHGALIKAALSAGGPQAALTELAKALDAWALLLDAEAAVRHGAPDHARRHAAGLRMDLDSLGLDTPLQAASLSVAGDQVAVLPISVHGRVGGYLGVGRSTALSPVERSVVIGAVGLLSLDMAGELALNEADRRDRRAVVQLITTGHPELAGTTAETLQVAIPPAPLRVAMIGGSRESITGLMRAAEQERSLQHAGALVAQHDKRSAVVLLPVAEGDLQALEEVLHRVPHTRCVVSEGVGLNDVPDAFRRVRSVYFGTARDTERLVLAKDVATAGLLAQLDTPGAHGWAAALLEPLDRHANRSQLDLISTLRVFLANNGQIDTSAKALGIHRHTMRYRLGRVAELLDRSLENPTTRAELWLALRLRELR
jgi:PucR family transcriptional regulator, purine catabolism regulatory protein